MVWLLLTACAASTPMPTLLRAAEDGPYLKWADAKVVHASGEVAGVYDEATGRLAVTGVEPPISLRGGDVVSRTAESREVTLMGHGCEASVDGSVFCDGLPWGTMSPPGLGERAEALLVTLVLYRPPAATRVSLQATRLDAPSVTVTASADVDGTVRDGLSCPEFASGCTSGSAIGSWTPEALTLEEQTVVLADRWSMTPEGARACAVGDAKLCVVLPPETGWADVGGQRVRLQGNLAAWRPLDASWEHPRARAAHVAAVSLLDEALAERATPPPPPPPP